MTDDAADLSLVEILGRLTDRKLSARELVNDCLRRIETAEPTMPARRACQWVRWPEYRSPSRICS